MFLLLLEIALTRALTDETHDMYTMLTITCYLRKDEWRLVLRNASRMFIEINDLNSASSTSFKRVEMRASSWNHWQIRFLIFSSIVLHESSEYTHCRSSVSKSYISSKRRKSRIDKWRRRNIWYITHERWIIFKETKTNIVMKIERSISCKIWLKNSSCKIWLKDSSCKIWLRNDVDASLNRLQ